MQAENDPSQDDFAADLCGFPVPAAEAEARGRETVEMLATRFAEECRSENPPTVDDYAARYPHLAGEIRETFPLIAALEEWKEDKEVECMRRNLRPKFDVKTIGRFQVEQEIGRGGMGIVFAATDPVTNRRVAIKLLPWHYGSSLGRWRQRFRREAELVSQLKQRHIVPIRAFGEHDGFCYYVMPLVQGLGLEKIIRELAQNETVVVGAAGEIRRDSWNWFANVAYQVALALHYAHRRGILHNDIKPANILLDLQGRVAVTDFGLAQLLEPDAAEPGGRLSGTLRYMGPERFSGEGDVRSDLFSLGATLYELVTRRPAFDAAERVELLKQIERCRPPRPRAIDRRIPRGLEVIISTCLAGDPAERYQTAAELLADLLRFINGSRVRAKRPGRLRRLFRALRRTGPIRKL